MRGQCSKGLCRRHRPTYRTPASFGYARPVNDLPNDKAIPGVATFRKGPGGLDVLDVVAPAAEARIFVQGAQLTHWQPRGASPAIFLSEQSGYQPGKAIRGGIPVCLPWFGPRDGSPAHGFARNRAWQVAAVEQTADGRVRASFALRSDPETRALWPHDFAARLTCTVGATLEVALEMENTGAAPFTFSEALHTYFAVSDAREARVEGLDGALYRDFPDRTRLCRQRGPLRFNEETDRAYVDTDARCVLVDPGAGRSIVVDKSGSNSTVVWNPWMAKAAALADLGDDEWPRMVCIETANAFENAVRLEPGASHRMTVGIAVEAHA